MFHLEELTNFKIFINHKHAKEIKILKSIFPAGEVNITVHEFPTDCLNSIDVTIYAMLRNSEDVMSLLLITDAIRRRSPIAQVSLFLPYLPYGRQDKFMEGEALSIKVFGDLINSQNYKTVFIVDPHSDVTQTCINRLVVYHQEFLIYKMFSYLTTTYPDINPKDFAIVSPDAGSAKKIQNIVFYPNHDILSTCEVVYFNKQRIGSDIKSTFAYSTCEDISNKHLVVVDDICDGGKTFIKLADAIAQQFKRQNLILFTTVGIYSSGISELRKYYSKILCAVDFSAQEVSSELDIIEK